jgi:hypothetical protein
MIEKRSKTRQPGKGKMPFGRAARKKDARHSHMGRAAHVGARSGKEPLFVVRDSPIHGRGVYATRRIRKGTRIAEYLGERISHDEADDRYAAKEDDGHTFLFVVNDEVCIDATYDGNDARFINHSCDPNCESNIEDDRVFVDAIRTIEAGEELGYDYSLTWESTDDPQDLQLYNCRCGALECRGTMLSPEPVDFEEKKKDKKKKKKKNKKDKKDAKESKKDRKKNKRKEKKKDKKKDKKKAGKKNKKKQK